MYMYNMRVWIEGHNGLNEILDIDMESVSEERIDDMYTWHLVHTYHEIYIHET